MPSLVSHPHGRIEENRPLPADSGSIRPDFGACIRTEGPLDRGAMAALLSSADPKREVESLAVFSSPVDESRNTRGAVSRSCEGPANDACGIEHPTSGVTAARAGKRRTKSRTSGCGKRAASNASTCRALR